MGPPVGKITASSAKNSSHNEAYVDYLYSRLQRDGYLRRDCQRLVNNDRNVFAASMVALGHADAMVTGVSRKSSVVLDDIGPVFETRQGRKVVGVSAVLARGRPFSFDDFLVTSAVLGIGHRGAETGRVVGTHRFADLGDQHHLAIHHLRFVEVGRAVVRQEFLQRDLMRQVERGVEGLAAVFGEARIRTQPLHTQHFVQHEIEIAPVADGAGVGAGSVAGGHACVPSIGAGEHRTGVARASKRSIALHAGP